jgi:hypothetical protein
LSWSCWVCVIKGFPGSPFPLSLAVKTSGEKKKRKKGVKLMGLSMWAGKIDRPPPSTFHQKNKMAMPFFMMFPK